MGEQHTGKAEAGMEVSKREEREQRILDAAAELLERWGYRKVTIDDIAKQAGVAKGTIYLHWKTREDLFVALIAREKFRLLADVQQRMAVDPDGWTMVGLVKHSTLATLQQPLMKALFLRDVDALGELVPRVEDSELYQSQVQGYMHLLEFLRQHGVLRDDIDLRTQVFTLISVAWGFILVEPVLPEMFKFPDEETVEIMA
ncbi:MAG: TetR/AcrR family transcriptional regulator, partial [Ktedonobacteraceae bacterium]